MLLLGKTQKKHPGNLTHGTRPAPSNSSDGVTKLLTCGVVNKQF